MQKFTIIMAQIDTLVGDIEGNTHKIIEVLDRITPEAKPDLIIFPELTLTGYPPEDLLLRDSLELRIEAALSTLKAVSLKYDCCMVFGAPLLREGQRFNAALVLHKGEFIAEYHKQRLPNIQVFDEHRYFIPGSESCTFRFKGRRFGLTICEDIWHEALVKDVCALGIDCLINLNASPYHQGKPTERTALLKSHIEGCRVPIIYTNAVGGQDELVFDGGSMALDAEQQICVQAPFFDESLSKVIVDLSDGGFTLQQGEQAVSLSEMESIYQALKLGLKDYVVKNGFKGVILGLSGGIDSALTLAIAADALGAQNVLAVMMPFRYTSQMSQDDASVQAETLGVDYDVLAIESMYDAFMNTLAGQFDGADTDVTEQNLQARCRAVLLMALSNKKGYLLLTTGNKSEVSVGYCTLYGDMCGGFNPIKNLPKTKVYALSSYLNAKARSAGKMDVIPQRVIDRPPSAELAPDQVDEDSLPPYDVLDAILYRYIEEDKSAEAIVAEGYERDTVFRVCRLVDLNEYKRRQAAIGVRISERDFGRDRRYPITNGWKIGQ